MNRIYRLLLWIAVLSVWMPGEMQAEDNASVQSSQWKGKKVGILGDSMSIPTENPERKRFYSYLSETLGIEPVVYAISGFQWKDLLGLAKEMNSKWGENIDAIFIWAGTNDYNASTPIGEFYTEKMDSVNVNGRMLMRKHRTPVMTSDTFCGRINLLLSYLKTTYPEIQIILLTPVHRGYARFGDDNIQPDEMYANGEGRYIEDYVDAIKKGGCNWSIPVIDLYSISGFLPSLKSNDRYIQNMETDRLHPDKDGHKRLAETLHYQLLSLPSTFK